MSFDSGSLFAFNGIEKTEQQKGKKLSHVPLVAEALE